MSSWRATLLSDTPGSRREAKLGQIYRGWLQFRRNRLALLGLVIVVALMLVAAFAPWIATHEPYDQNLSQRLLPPGAKGHWLGTDEFGRDIFSRLVYGARVTLYIVVLVALIAAPIGLIVGTAAGYIGGWVDAALMRITDIFLAFPSLILALAFVAALGPGIVNMVFAIALSWWPGYARLVRGEVMSRKQDLYVTAARAVGAGPGRIVFRHILPNVMTPVIVKMSLDMGFAILTVASLGFIGIGVKPPTPEWGSLLSVARSYMPDFWWTAIFPGLAILLAVFGFNVLGDGLRDVFDPRSRR